MPNRHANLGRPRRSPHWGATLSLFATVFSAGCSGDAVSQLGGTWIGRPDAPAATRTRAAEEDAAAGDAATADPEGSPTDRPPTDWQQYDAEVRLEFLPGHKVQMTMTGRKDTIRGTWKAIDSTPGAALIEIRASVDSADSNGPTPRRRFELAPDFDDDGRLIGFSMSEDGADRRVGSLYFRRASDSTSPDS